jgi:hypothetical protein
MKLNCLVSAISICTILSPGVVSAKPTPITPSGGAFVNYTWMNAVVNKTPVVSAACPSIETDIYGDGFKVARQKSFYGSLAATAAKWFPSNSQWASVGIGPIKNSFGIYFTEIDKLSELSEVKEKKLPNNYEEIQKWKVSDSAYWESQGGVSFYMGTGIAPVAVGVFAIATGGWVSFLQKTGPNKVYVELAKKKIRAISISAGVGVPVPIPIRTPGPNVSLDKHFESSNGFSYEFNLDNNQNIEAFERFMAGDMTKAQDLSKLTNSGVTKLSDMSDIRVGLSRSMGIATPYIPVISFKMSVEKAYDKVEESSIWDEDIKKDTGIYIKQRNSYIFGQQFKVVRSFQGGKSTIETAVDTGTPTQTDKLFGNFKYAYQSNWGQERRLRKYINKVKSLTGLVTETCARVPAFKDSLGFNQVVLEMNWSDEYVREILGQGKQKENFLQTIKSAAQRYQILANNSDSPLCLNSDDDKYDDNCTTSTSAKIDGIFNNLQNYSNQMNKSLNTDRKEFAKNMAKFGEEVWKSPYVFKAFYEKGKLCGQEFRYEISGQRLTRHVINQKYVHSMECTGM